MGRQRHAKKPMSNVACPICNGRTEGFHFSILSCRPCASFFRRTVASKHTYTCSLNQDCILDHTNRTMCKGCRFKRCIEAGMQASAVQYNRDPIGSKKQRKTPGKDKSEYSVPSTSSTTSSSCEEVNSSLLSRMTSAYHAYCKSEKSLYSLLFPDNPVNNDSEYELATHSDFIKMERGNLSFMYTMVNEWCPAFSILPTSTKMEQFRSIAGALIPLIKTYRTSIVFPKHDDTRIFLSYGQFMNEEGMEYHFKDDPDPKQSSKINYEMYKNSCRNARKIKRLEMTETEFIALAGIIFTNEVSLHCVCPDVAQMQEQVIRELYEYVVQKYGAKMVGPRMGSLILMLNDTDILRRHVIEAVTVSRMFNKHLLELWD